MNYEMRAYTEETPAVFSGAPSDGGGNGVRPLCADAHAPVDAPTVEKILLVDDEPDILSTLQHMLQRDFQVETASDGYRALERIRDSGPYAVVVSDMRMPGMSGSQFLARAREASPDTVRILLTGYADVDAAMDAVNEGSIFRFLAKPCGRALLTSAVHSGVQQYAIKRSEKDLLEKTLLGGIKVLADFLSVSSPEAFGRSMRIAHFVRCIAGNLGCAVSWQLEAAAMLSQLGCIAIDSTLMKRAFVGAALTPEEQARFNAHPQAAMRLLSHIPRLEPVAWIIGQQLNREISTDAPVSPAWSNKESVLSAKILRLAVAFDDLRMTPMSDERAICILKGRYREFDREMVDALVGVKAHNARMESRRLPIRKLAIGMVLDQEIRNKQGMLLVAKGQELTGALLAKVDDFARAGLIENQVVVLVPV
jgi:response regulator RpfG family c-di-GMP phosphodiesterase